MWPAILGAPRCCCGKLSADSDYLVRAAVGRHPSCPLDTVLGLARRHEPAVNAGIAARADCTEEILRELYGGSHVGSLLRWSVAAHPACPSNILQSLAEECAGMDMGLRQALLRNPACPAAALDILYSDWKPDAAAVAVHPNCSAALLERMSRQCGDRSGEIIAGHPACTPATLMSLFDRQGMVRTRRAAAAAMASRPSQLILVSDGAGGARWCSFADILQRSLLPAARALTEDQACPGHLLAILAGHRDPVVQSDVARHPGATAAILVSLLGCPHGQVVQAVVSNPNLPRSALAMWQLAR